MTDRPQRRRFSEFTATEVDVLYRGVPEADPLSDELLAERALRMLHAACLRDHTDFGGDMELVCAGSAGEVWECVGCGYPGASQARIDEIAYRGPE